MSQFVKIIKPHFHAQEIQRSVHFIAGPNKEPVHMGCKGIPQSGVVGLHCVHSPRASPITLRCHKRGKVYRWFQELSHFLVDVFHIVGIIVLIEVLTMMTMQQNNRENMSFQFLFILLCSRLCPSTAESSPLPEYSNFLCICYPCPHQCHLSNDD